MQLVNLTTYRVNDKLNTELLAFDVDDIIVPIRANGNLKSYFIAKAKQAIIEPNATFKVNYEVNESLSVIKSLSPKLLILTVVSRQNYAFRNEVMVFNTSHISQFFKTVSTGTQFNYCENGDPATVIYVVSESITDIMAQQQAGIDPSVLADIEKLKNNEYKITYFASISAAAGAITVPTGATILLDQFPGGIDGYISIIQNGQPTGKFPKDAAGNTLDVASFDAMGNYTLTGTPSAYPVAFIYTLKIKAIDYFNLTTANILELINLGAVANTEVAYGDLNNSLQSSPDIKVIPGSNISPSYANPGGMGSRTTLIAIATNAVISGSTNELINGLFTDTFYFNLGVPASNVGKYIVYDFGSPKIITEAIWYQDINTTHGTWQWAGSSDNVSYTSIGSTYTLGGGVLGGNGYANTQTTLSGNATAYRYYRMIGISGNYSGDPFLREMEFKINSQTNTQLFLGNVNNTDIIVNGNVSLANNGGKLGVFGKVPISQPTVAGTSPVATYNFNGGNTLSDSDTFGASGWTWPKFVQAVFNTGLLNS